jgi:TPP-dependent pyruvate/acetoin dehydrogenase alpha subunit
VNTVLAAQQATALEALDAAHRRALDVVDPALIELITTRIEHTLTGAPTPREPTDDRGRDVAAIVDQMLIDVGAASDELVERANRHFPDGGVADLVMAAYIIEARTRLRVASDRLWSNG